MRLLTFHRQQLDPKLLGQKVVVTALLSIAGLTFSARAQTLTVLYAFTGGIDGGTPYAGVIRDGAGNLYGTTEAGGTSGCGGGGCGTVFKIDTNGKESVLYTFTGGADGGNPYYGSLLQDAKGNLYGTTLQGGIAYGVLYKVTPAREETVVHNFPSSPEDGDSPVAGLIHDAQGNAYGTTEAGGTSSGCQGVGCGTVYKVDHTGKETVLYSFTGQPDGAVPVSSLILDKAGNLYGATQEGGTNGYGTVFKLDPNGQETILHNFAGYPSDGLSPSGGLILDGAGNLYGTTFLGGTTYQGIIFEIIKNGGESVLYNFAGGPSDGAFPTGNLLLDKQGNLYGITTSGGTLENGVVFKFNRSGETVLHNFVFTTEGSTPRGGLIRDSAGNLYGTTSQGGPSQPACDGLGCGTVFKLTP
jgi:uncharacterized repeat protein (TIGR03803 family)